MLPRRAQSAPDGLLDGRTRHMRICTHVLSIFTADSLLVTARIQPVYFRRSPARCCALPQLQNGPPTTNEAMTQMLLNHGSICTESVVKAFRAVDRGFFIDPPDDGRNEEVRYINMPFRNGVQHLSAPGIYGTAIEALDLREGLSFLNVCSGTGYFSALACQILGTRVRARAPKVGWIPLPPFFSEIFSVPLTWLTTTLRQAVHAAIELRGELVTRAREKLDELGCTNVDLRHGSCLEIEAEGSMRFQRIYIGAGADESMASILFGCAASALLPISPLCSPLFSRPSLSPTTACSS